MKKTTLLFVLLTSILISSCRENKNSAGKEFVFPARLVKFKLLKQDAVFGGTGKNTWDKLIRERGFILREGNKWRLYYSGYNPDSSDVKYLGLAVSEDGINWTRYSKHPIFSEDWVEDMYVIKNNGIYYMFAEGLNDIPHWLTSKDGIHWHNEGRMRILKTDGKTVVSGAAGTPTLWIEDGLWYLFYERGDQGIWLATAKSPDKWRNFSDDPVISLGDSGADRYAVAANCIVKDSGLYYTYYHAADDSLWSRWTVNAAVSSDLYHWKKYDKNPIIGYDNSSPIVIPYGTGYRLYTMHPTVHVYESISNN